MAQAFDLGVDLGTSNVIIYGKNKGIVLNEPALVVMDRETQDVKAVGKDARRMVGRTPGTIDAIRPLQNGTMPDFKLTATMLHYFVSQIIGKRIFSGPRVVMCLPAGINEVEAQHLASSLFEAGVRRTQLLEKPIAAAIGANISVGAPYGRMVVDIGGGVTEIAVISSGRCVVRDNIDIAGDKMNDAIIRYIRRKYNFAVGETTAEDIKITIGAAMRRETPLYMEVAGKDVLTGLPRLLKVNSDEVTEALDEPIHLLMERIHSVLERTPAELASDIFDGEIYLTGGGAQLGLLSEAISEQMRMKCVVAESAQETSAIGCGRTLENWSEFGRYLINARTRR